jgi:hypothetical protein
LQEPGKLIGAADACLHLCLPLTGSIRSWEQRIHRGGGGGAVASSGYGGEEAMAQNKIRKFLPCDSDSDSDSLREGKEKLPTKVSVLTKQICLHTKSLGTLRGTKSDRIARN